MWFEQKNQLHQPNLDKFMEKLYDYLPQQLVTFILVTLFSLLIGLSQRRISLRREGETTLSAQTGLLLLSVFWDISSIYLILRKCIYLWEAG